MIIKFIIIFYKDTRMETPISLTSSTPIPAGFSSSITSSIPSTVATPTPIVTQGK